MMTLEQYNLNKLSEECSEVAQRCMKQQQFGRDERQIGHEFNNGERLREEVLDMLMWVKILTANQQFLPITEEDVLQHWAVKKPMLTHMLTLSVAHSQLERWQQ